jgi:hypothetical protein
MSLLSGTEEVMHVRAGEDFLWGSRDDSIARLGAGRGPPIGPHRSFSLSALILAKRSWVTV